ncbi:hypothetical protein D3C78_1687780 [compost metagenome]
MDHVVAGKRRGNHDSAGAGLLCHHRPVEQGFCRCGDVRHETRPSAVPGIGFADGVDAGRQPFGKWRRPLVDQPMVVLDEMHAAEREVMCAAGKLD